MHGARLVAGRQGDRGVKGGRETESQEQGRERYEGEGAKRGRLQDESGERRECLIRSERHGRTN